VDCRLDRQLDHGFERRIRHGQRNRELLFGSQYREHDKIRRHHDRGNFVWC
jgi:hypothetical protein